MYTTYFPGPSLSTALTVVKKTESVFTYVVVTGTENKKEVNLTQLGSRV